MGERPKSKSDLNPGEPTHGKMEIPKRPKRQSLSSAVCLPKIKESGELQQDPVSHHTLENGTSREDQINAKLSRNDIAVLTTDSTNSTDNSRAVYTSLSTSAGLNNIKKQFHSFVDNLVETKDSVKCITCHKKDEDKCHQRLPEVPRNKSLDINSKPCAISKLKENTNDVLAVIEKMKNVHRLDSQVEKQNKRQCSHHSKGVSTVNGNRQEKCLIREITNAAEKFTSFDTNRFLVEILYPHDFYDKYSRSRRKKEPTNSNIYQIPIIKQVKVVRKENVSKPFISNENTDKYQSITQNSPVGDTFVHRGGTPGKEMEQISPKSRLFGLPEQDRSTMHARCRKGTQAVFIIDNADQEKPQLRGLKGTVRRENLLKDKLDRHASRSMYEVNSLGMQFSLPDYNGSLHNRKTSFSRQITCLSPIQNQAISPQSVFEYGGYRAMHTPRMLQRGVTFAGFDNYQKLISNSSHEREITRSNVKKKDPQHTTVSLNREMTVTSSTRVSKIENSLTPVEDNPLSTNMLLRSSTTT